MRSPFPVSTYPPSRLRQRGAGAGTAILYGRVDGLTTEFTCSDVDQTVVTFAGQPDAIMVAVRGNPALFTFTDRLNRESSVLLVPQLNSITVYLKRDRVLARNASAGNNAVVSVIGLWAQPDEPGIGEETS